jgi:hypothetical protein
MKEPVMGDPPKTQEQGTKKADKAGVNLEE